MTRITLLTQFILTLILTTLLTHGARAATPWYQVELFIFSQNQEDLAAEFWDNKTIPTHLGNALYLPGSGESSDTNGSAYPILPAGQRNLAISKSLMKKNGYRPLFSRAWKQPIYRKGKARPIRITGGDQLNDARYELEGEISIDIARYLHLRTNLYYTLRVGNNWESPYIPKPVIDNPISPIQTPEEFVVTATTQETEEEEQNFIAPLKDPTLLSVKMEQGRRMRGSETHYLDHPMFGLFIRLTRITPPTQGNAGGKPSPTPTKSHNTVAQSPDTQALTQ